MFCEKMISRQSFEVETSETLGSVGKLAFGLAFDDKSLNAGRLERSASRRGLYGTEAEVSARYQSGFGIVEANGKQLRCSNQHLTRYHPSPQSEGIPYLVNSHDNNECSVRPSETSRLVLACFLTKQRCASCKTIQNTLSAVGLQVRILLFCLLLLHSPLTFIPRLTEHLVFQIEARRRVHNELR